MTGIRSECRNSPLISIQLQFNCPHCGLSMLAPEGSSGTVECPGCSKQFVLEAKVPVVPVVQARAVASQAQPPRGRGAHPALAPRPQGPRPGPYPPNAAKESRMPFYGLGAAGVLLVGVVIWLNSGGHKPAPPPAKPPEEARALSPAVVPAPAPAVDSEKAKLNEELKQIKDAIAAKELKEREESERAFDAVQTEATARYNQETQKILEYFTTEFFAGDQEAARTFMDVQRDVMWGISNLMNDGDSSNDPESEEELKEYVAQRLVLWFEKKPVLSKWLEDHQKDTRKFVDELMDADPETKMNRGPAFDFTKYAGVGSGFWISGDGWMLTNEHVVGSAKKVDLRLGNGDVIEAEVVKADATNDLALIKASRGAQAWLAVSKGDNDLQLGRTVFTVGYPNPMLQGVEPKFTDGRVSAASGVGDRKDSYQTSIPVHRGNSGGPLVDFTTGWVVGVVNAKLMGSDGERADNVSYAIKCRVVSEFLEKVPEAKAAMLKNPPTAPAKRDEQEVIDRATKASVLVLRPR